MRSDLILSQKIVVATGILFNISRMWKYEVPEDDSDSEGNSDDKGGLCYSALLEGDPGTV